MNPIIVRGYVSSMAASSLTAYPGGVLYAISIGLIMKSGATTGGMDIIVKWLRLKLPYLKTGVLFFITDAAFSRRTSAPFFLSR